jgi:amidase
MRYIISFLSIIFFVACKNTPSVYWKPYDETAELQANQTHENSRMQFRLIQSKLLDKNEIWAPFEKALNRFGNDTYQALKPLIIEQDIPTLQTQIQQGLLTYEQLVLFYLYRIRKFESNPNTTLHAILALNPKVIEQAVEKDRQQQKNQHPIYGMPILLKDNINTQDMPTTAGAAYLQDHTTENDAFVVSQLKAKGALILGKVNLSEWAYYFCDGCPLGYSAVGGQTLNPYGRKLFETGGSSSGSGVAVAANYAVAAIGSETSGSILSPSGHNSVVGCKPTIGLISRTGIVPISSTLDTAGPMTKTVVDNAILIDAMKAKDIADPITSKGPDSQVDYILASQNRSFTGFRLGAIKSLVDADSLYRKAINTLRINGAEVIEYEPPNTELTGFMSLLNAEMKTDLPNYFNSQANSALFGNDVQSVIDFNQQDSVLRMPYGQTRLEGVVAEELTDDELQSLVDRLNHAATSFFNAPIDIHNLDAILSLNNYHAAYAAAAFYPCLTVPMGYTLRGEPKNLTFVAPSFQEQKLYSLGAAFESLTRYRELPKGYE